MARVLDPQRLIGEVPASEAGPIAEAELGGLRTPPWVSGPKALHVLRFTQRQIEFVFKARRERGEVFRMRGTIPGGPVITSHPDHIRSIFTAKPELVPSVTAESPLRPVVGPNSVLTANGPRHMRQRKLLLPPFHGEAIARYSEMIRDAAEREIERWPIGEPFALTPRMQAITLDVIMAGIFGIEERPDAAPIGDGARPTTRAMLKAGVFGFEGADAGSPERALRAATREFVGLSMTPLAQFAQLVNVGRSEPTGLLKTALEMLDTPTYAIIAARRADAGLGERRDILSMLMQARTEDGELLSDEELRDELLSLVLAGHETTANQLAWTWERLVRTPSAHERLVESVRSGSNSDSDDNVEAVITESMRSRPVIPIVGRRVAVPWRLGEFGVPAGTPVSASILLLHHRDDLYPDPFAFRPERWLGGVKPGTYEWIPFGGGTRRCLGAALAMAEQRVVLETMARRLDLAFAEPEPERAVHRNVTMIPAHGARVVVRART